MEKLVAALVARRYYLEGRTKIEIGNELGISRFRVARILEQAMREGIVQVKIEIPPDVDLELSEKLADRFGLRQALVLRNADDHDDVAMRRQLGKACTALLPELLSEDDVLGVAWGRTLHALVESLPPLPRVDVVQMVGSVPRAELSINSMDLVRRLGECTGGRVYALHVPMIVSPAQVAASLRRDEHVADTLAACSTITYALVGIGAWVPGQSSVRAALPGRFAKELDEAGAVADICSTVVNADGKVVGGDGVESLCISVTTDQLRAVPNVIGLAGGSVKATAITAVVRAGLVHRLITDKAAATAMLELD